MVANDYVSVNGRKIRTNYGTRLNDLKVGSKVGIRLTENGGFQLCIDGVKEEEMPGGFISKQPAYAFFDLYGQCQQIRIVNNKVACEKADLEADEKERCELVLPLAGTSGSQSVASSVVDVSGHSISSCAYRNQVMKFKKALVLPGNDRMQDNRGSEACAGWKLLRDSSDNANLVTMVPSS